MKKFNDTSPIYVQLKQEVEDSILAGALKTDEVIQSIRTLALQYSINPLTVSKAISELENDGVIYKKRGIGFFVAPEAQTNIRKQRLKAYLEKDVKDFVHKAIQLGIELPAILNLIKTTYEEETHVSTI